MQAPVLHFFLIFGISPFHGLFCLNDEVLHSGQGVNGRGVSDALVQGVTSVSSEAGPLSLSLIQYLLPPPSGPECHLNFQSPW